MQETKIGFSVKRFIILRILLRLTALALASLIEELPINANVAGVGSSDIV